MYWYCRLRHTFPYLYYKHKKQVLLTMAIIALLKNEKLHQASKIMVIKTHSLACDKKVQKYIHFVDLINTTQAQCKQLRQIWRKISPHTYITYFFYFCRENCHDVNYKFFIVPTQWHSVLYGHRSIYFITIFAFFVSSIKVNFNFQCLRTRMKIQSIIYPSFKEYFFLTLK